VTASLGATAVRRGKERKREVFEPVEWPPRRRQEPEPRRETEPRRDPARRKREKMPA
jgi:hypothetical protein